MLCNGNVKWDQWAEAKLLPELCSTQSVQGESPPFPFPAASNPVCSLLWPLPPPSKPAVAITSNLAFSTSSPALALLLSFYNKALWDYLDPRQWDYPYSSPLLIYSSHSCVIPLAKLSVVTSVLPAETQSHCICCILLDPSASSQAKRAGATGCPCCFLYLLVETLRTQTPCTFFKIHEIIAGFINCKRRKYQILMGIWTLFLSSSIFEYLY